MPRVIDRMRPSVCSATATELTPRDEVMRMGLFTSSGLRTRSTPARGVCIQRSVSALSTCRRAIPQANSTSAPGRTRTNASSFIGRSIWKDFRARRRMVSRHPSGSIQIAWR